MHVLGAGNRPLVLEQVGRLLVPGVDPMVISADRFGMFIDERFLRPAGGPGTGRIAFQDLNPRRPPLFLNSTIVSSNRGGLDDAPETSDGKVLCPWIGAGRGFLRRRTPDEFFHFAFSDTYFRLIGSDRAIYPLGDAIAASADFPALIEPAILKDYCKRNETYLRLIDGGANDNQALIEIFLNLTEIMFGQRRSPIQSPLMRRDEHAEILLINSAVTETTGRPADKPPDRPHQLVSFGVDLVDRVTSATDTYSGVGYNLRKQLYLREIASLEPRYKDRIHPIEISLTELDQYAHGGSEAALRLKSGIDPGQMYPGPGEALERQLATKRRLYQSHSYQRLMAIGAAELRSRYRVSSWHPQCYFEIRAELDRAISEVDEDDQACLREAARWATLLRAQEQCEHKTDAHIPAGLSCDERGLVKIPNVAVLEESNQKLRGVCNPSARKYADAAGIPLEEWLRPSSGNEEEVTCRKLDEAWIGQSE